MNFFRYSCLGLLLATAGRAQSPSPPAWLRAEGLQRDFVVLQRAYETLHPGLYQYVSKATVDAQFAACRRALAHDQSLGDAYLALVRLTASFHCGHSYPNFWNQEAAVQQALFDQPTCLPLHFQVVGNRLLVTRSVVPAVPAGRELCRINGHPAAQVIARLLPYVRADGRNDNKRRALLSVRGLKFEYFDILYPLLYPGEPQGKFELELRDVRTGTRQQVTVSSLTREGRAARMAQQYPALATAPLAELRWTDERTAVLKLNSFVDWNTQFDLSGFLRQSFAEINRRRAATLVLDIRALEGGNDKYNQQVVEQLLHQPLEVQHLQNTWAYTSVDTTLSRYFTNKSWAGAWLSRPADQFMRTAAGQYRDPAAAAPVIWKPVPQPFQGHVFLLTSVENSSAGFLLAQVLKQHQLATLVGQPTGGNQRGITAGALFFVRLPYSGLEVDVPLIGTGYDVAAGLPDAGIAPDVLVEPRLEDLARGTDAELAAVQRLSAAGAGGH